MHTAVHGLVRLKAGEPATLIFTVTDREGLPVDLAGAQALYKLARRAGDDALLTLTEGGGIALSANVATVSLETAELSGPGGLLTGDFLGQLTLIKDGDGLVAAEGPLSIEPVIS